VTLVNAETGEVVRDPQSVVDFLENVQWMLDAALEMRGAADVAVVKAQVVMAETYARELKLSKDNRDKAAEMVRRSEWSLEQAIQRDKDAGLIKSQADGGGTYVPGQRGSSPRSATDRDDRPSAKDFFSNGGERSEVFQMGQATREEFDKALEEAKAEGNLSRANVVRKVKGEASPSTFTRQQRADLIAELAEQGMSSRQMPARVGVTEETVRQIARDFDIEIPADRIVGRSKRLDHTQIVESTVTDLENTAEFVHAHIDLNEVDFSEADEWVSSLSKSISALTRFRNQIKEKTHV
jgi:transposase